MDELIQMPGLTITCSPGNTLPVVPNLPLLPVTVTVIPNERQKRKKHAVNDEDVVEIKNEKEEDHRTCK